MIPLKRVKLRGVVEVFKPNSLWPGVHHKNCDRGSLISTQVKRLAGNGFIL